MYDHKEFAIIDVIVSFSGGKGFGKVGARMEITIQVFLHEDAPQCCEGSINHDKEGFGVVWKGEDRLFQEGLLYFGKGDFVVNGPLPLGIFVSEGQQGFGKIGESRNELPIEVAESNKGSDCFYVTWGVPVFDCFELCGVYFYGPGRDEKAEVLYLGSVEGAFGEFEGESLLAKSF